MNKIETDALDAIIDTCDNARIVLNKCRHDFKSAIKRVWVTRVRDEPLDLRLERMEVARHEYLHQVRVLVEAEQQLDRARKLRT